MGAGISIHRIALIAAAAALCMASQARGALVVSAEEAARVERGEDPASLDQVRQMQEHSVRATPTRPSRKVEGTLLATAVKRGEAEAAAERKAAARRRAELAEDVEVHPVPLWEIIAIVGAVASGIVSIWLIRSRRYP